MTKEWTPEEEREVADEAQAVFVNRFWVEWVNGLCRVMFMERSRSGERQHARCAVVMSVESAAELRELLPKIEPIAPKRGTIQ